MINLLKILSLSKYLLCFLLLCLAGRKEALSQELMPLDLPNCKSSTQHIQVLQLTPHSLRNREELPPTLHQYLSQRKYKIGSVVLALKNSSDDVRDIVIRFGEFEKVVLLTDNKNTQNLYQTGFKATHQSKNVVSPLLRQSLIRLRFQPNEKRQVFIYFVSSTYLPTKVKVGLQCEEAWQSDYHWHLWIQAFFLGILSLFIVVLFFIYLNNNSLTYFYFFVYCFLIEVSSLVKFNYFTHFTNDSFQDYLIWALTSQLAAIFFIEFIRKAIDASLYSIFFDNLLKLLILSRVIAFLSSLYVFVSDGSVPFASAIIAWIDISNIIVAFWILIYYSIHGNKFMRYLAISTSLLVVGLLFNIVYNFGYVRYTLEIPYFFDASIVGQVFVICLGIGLQIEVSIKNERKAQAKVLVLQKEINVRLEQKVNERTEALEKANREIQLRNDELNQQQEEILSINNHLESLVEIRTLEIKKQNELLRNYAYFNAHKVRGPLARILGLIYLVKIETPQQTADFLDFIQRLEVCANELDFTIREINEILSDEETRAKD